jgi:hypothetical protein
LVIAQADQRLLDLPSVCFGHTGFSRHRCR